MRTFAISDYTLTMHILILTYQGNIAGSTYSISMLAKGLAQRGHKVFLGCPSDRLLVTLVQDSGVQHIPMNFRSKFDLSNMRHIRDLVKKHDIQIINAQSSYDRYTCVFARWIYRLPVKIVHTRRQVAASMGGFLQNLIYYRGTHKVIAVSHGVKQSLVGKGIPSHHVEVIHNGTPREKYQNLNPENTHKLRNTYNIKEGEFVIGCVSRRKKQEQLLEALDLLPFRTTTLFVGLDLQEKYLPLLEKVNDRHTIIFTGSVPPEQTLDYYGLFDVNILVSTTEGLSQALLEAMAIGVPVIATHAAGNPELVIHGENGLTFTDGDIPALAQHIQTLHDQPQVRETFIEKGRKTALEDFSIDRTIERHEALFHRLLQPQKKTHHES